LESIDDGCNFLDEFTEAAEALTDLGRARTKQITTELTTAINQTRLTIKGATEAISSRASTSSLLFGNDLSQLTTNEEPDDVVEPLKASTSRTPKTSQNSNGTTPKSTRTPKDHGDFTSPRKTKNGTTPTRGQGFEYTSPRKNHTGTSTQPLPVIHNNNNNNSATKSPRHGKLQVIHPLKEYPKRLIALDDENEYDGGEFGMI
jgi:hypothetical protein